MNAPIERAVSQLLVAPRKTIAFVLGDIIDEQTDAIVNAANSALVPGAGVCGAIHKRGGPAIYAECREIIRRHRNVEEGHAVITNGGDLPARFVVHTVGPVWRGGTHGEPEKLASSYRESITLADQRGLRSVAFPAISTGVFGYPVEAAAKIAMEAAAGALERTANVNDVHFVLFDPATYATFVTAAERLASERKLKFDRYVIPS